MLIFSIASSGVEKACAMQSFFVKHIKLLKKAKISSRGFGSKQFEKPARLLWPAKVEKTNCFRGYSKKISFSHPGQCALGATLFAAVTFAVLCCNVECFNKI
jgi:hypothetical protein